MVVLAIGLCGFWLAKQCTIDLGVRPADFKLRQLAWFIITGAAFLSNNFWLFCLITVLVLWRASRQDSNVLALYFFVLFAVPLFKIEIPALGLVNKFFELSYFRLLALVLLMPMALRLRRLSDATPFGTHGADKFLFVYTVYLVGSLYQYTSLTNLARVAFEYVIDIFLPYYVASRYLRTQQQFNDVFFSLTTAALIAGLVGFFEMARGWMLYSTVPNALGFVYPYSGGYLMRGDSLRAAATSGQPIALGFMLMMGVGCFVYLSQAVSERKTRLLVFGALAMGLVGPLSRGPWVGTLVIILVYVVLSPQTSRLLARLLFGAVAAFVVLLMSPYYERVINLLPFVGSVDAENVEFRQKLLTNALIVIERNPWFGSFSALSTAELEELRAGGDGGIIDIVNSYVGIALPYGLIGLTLFAGFFAACGKAALSAKSTLLRLGADNPLALSLGNVLLAILAGVLVTIYTVSSISFIPILYWSLAGFCLAYAQMLRQQVAVTA